MIPQDPAILLSYINMKLRNQYKNLKELCIDLDIEKEALEEKLESIDYHYDEVHNKFINTACKNNIR